MKDGNPELFDFLQDINIGKKNILEHNPQWERFYSPALINVILSGFMDTLPIVMELNKLPFALTKQQHYAYLINSVRRRRRFKKFVKAIYREDDISLLCKAFEISRDDAFSALDLISPDDMERLRGYYDNREGGHDGKRKAVGSKRGGRNRASDRG